MWRVGDCKIIAVEHVATQHKPLVCVVRPFFFQSFVCVAEELCGGTSGKGDPH